MLTKQVDSSVTPREQNDPVSVSQCTSDPGTDYPRQSSDTRVSSALDSLANSVNATTPQDPTAESLKPLGREHPTHCRIMVMTPERVLYVGLLGQPTVRTLGAVTIYFSLGSPFFLRTDDGRWNQHEYAMLLPYVSHQVTTTDKLIGVILIEPETINLDRLCDLYGQPETMSSLSVIAHRACAIHDNLKQESPDSISDNHTFDMNVFGEDLQPRPLDPRIKTIAHRINEAPQDQWLAEQCAESVSLSFSRFLHLFKQELKVPFRAFVAWKRARSLLRYVSHTSNLTNIALEIGYPDATHFSHSIRKAYGLKPKDIFAGSRSLVLYR